MSDLKKEFEAEGLLKLKEFYSNHLTSRVYTIPLKLHLPS